jgi:hypothetical protein
VTQQPNIVRRSYRFGQSTYAHQALDLEVRERAETVAIVMPTETLVALTPAMARILADRLYELAALVEARNP